MKTLNLLLISTLASLATVGCSGGDDDDTSSVGGNSGTNGMPTATADTFTTQADASIEDELTGDDPDGDALTFAVESEPKHGDLTLEEDGSFTYRPGANAGQDQFTFTVSDGNETSEPATVDITVESVQVSFSSYSREAFNQEPTDEPLPVNGREFDQDVDDETAYDDLLTAED